MTGLFGLLLVVPVADALYLPGFLPKQYEANASVELKVNKLTSVKTQLPYRYYTLPYCLPDVIRESRENLGETLMGDVIENSPYAINVLVNVSCRTLCSMPLSVASKEKFRGMIDEEYLVNWIVDNLPAATKYRRHDGEVIFTDGFFVGLIQNGHYYVHNHVTLELQYHTNPDVFEGYRIVGFDVEPRSNAPKDGVANCRAPPAPFDLDAHDKIFYTYDVVWTHSDVRWASRWDNYLKMASGQPQIHWFAILNSLVILLFLSGMVAMILLRTLYRDIADYNRVATSDEAREDTGWKLVHGDVFRKPINHRLLAVSVGSGVQLLGMSVVTLVFALLGVLSPVHRGALLQWMMMLFTLMGVCAGYSSARLCKVFEGDSTHWKSVTFLAALLYPWIFFSIFFVLNLGIWAQGSSGAVPFQTMFVLLLLWFGVSTPLVFFGAYVGYRQPTIELPVRISAIPRMIPEQPFLAQPHVMCLISGLLPFGAVFTELFFIMSSLWLHQFYYMFGFLALVLVILVITCAEISITLTYFRLTAEDHAWWWPSFFATASSGLYVFLYSIIYFASRLQIDKLISALLYFGYMSIISIMFALLTGSIGTLASFQLVRVIYGAIKVD